MFHGLVGLLPVSASGSASLRACKAWLLPLTLGPCPAPCPPADFASDPRYQPRELSPGAQARQHLREEQVGPGGTRCAARVVLLVLRLG